MYLLLSFSNAAPAAKVIFNFCSQEVCPNSRFQVQIELGRALIYLHSKPGLTASRLFITLYGDSGFPWVFPFVDYQFPGIQDCDLLISVWTGHIAHQMIDQMEKALWLQSNTLSTTDKSYWYESILGIYQERWCWKCPQTSIINILQKCTCQKCTFSCPTSEVPNQKLSGGSLHPAFTSSLHDSDTLWTFRTTVVRVYFSLLSAHHLFSCNRFCPPHWNHLLGKAAEQHHPCFCFFYSLIEVLIVSHNTCFQQIDLSEG